MDRYRLGRMNNPMRGLLHGAAAGAAVVGVVILAIRALDSRRLFAGLVFGLSLLAMFVISSLYHSVGWPERRKAFMQRLDHSMIFLVVAATFTPFGVRMICPPCWSATSGFNKSSRTAGKSLTSPSALSLNFSTGRV